MGMKGRFTTIMTPHEVKREIDLMIGDTRRPHYSFLLEAMRIREAMKSDGTLQAFLSNRGII